MATTKTILLIEDDKLMRHFIHSTLENTGFILIDAIGGKRSLEIIKQHHVDLILLDLYLSDGYGTNYIPDIKKHTNVPLIVFSGENNENKILDCYNHGVEDFIPKPCSPQILNAKIKAHIKRHENLQSEHISTQPVLFSKWSLNKEKFQVFNSDGLSAGLTIHEFNILNFMIKNAGRAIGRQEICEFMRNDGYIPTKRSIDIKITRLRKKLENDISNPQIIQTIRGVGYLFNQNSLKTL